MRSVQALAAAALLLLPAYDVASAAEPKQGGILRVYHRDSPGSASIHEGATYSVNIPFMPVFNNLVMFKQDVPQNSVESIVPDLAESWAWSSDNKTLTFKLRQGVKWHDGKPFTVGRRQMHLRHADGQVAAEVPPEPAQVLVRPGQRRHRQRRFRGVVQPEAAAAGAAVAARLRLHAGLSLPRLAGARCAPSRSAPARSSSSSSRPTNRSSSPRTPTTGRRACRYLDGIEFTIITNRSTAILGFVSGKFDMTFPTEVSIPLLKDVKSQAPNAVCVVEPINVSTNIIVNSSSPPFDNLDIRRALALALDRKAFIHDHVRGPGRYRRHHAAGAGRPVGDAEGNAGDRSRATAPTSTPTGKRRAS